MMLRLFESIKLSRGQTKQWVPFSNKDQQRTSYIFHSQNSFLLPKLSCVAAKCGSPSSWSLDTFHTAALPPSNLSTIHVNQFCARDTAPPLPCPANFTIQFFTDITAKRHSALHDNMGMLCVIRFSPFCSILLAPIMVLSIVWGYASMVGMTCSSVTTAT
jgi:hypothetical protein